MNGAITIGSLFLPDQALPFVLVAAGIAFMVGPRRLAGILGAIVLIMAVLPPFLEPLLETLPAGILMLMLLALGLSVLKAIATLLLGRGAADTMIGSLAAGLVLAVLRMPFRLIRNLARLLSGGR